MEARNIKISLLIIYTLITNGLFAQTKPELTATLRVISIKDNYNVSETVKLLVINNSQHKLYISLRQEILVKNNWKPFIADISSPETEVPILYPISPRKSFSMRYDLKWIKTNLKWRNPSALISKYQYRFLLDIRKLNTDKIAEKPSRPFKLFE
jgi:hypothetical protein